MHFTLWLNHANPDGAHKTVPWEEIVSFVAEPILHEDKPTLPGWSPAKFLGSRRAKVNVEAISLLVLDLDDTSLTLDGVAGVFAGVSGLVHTTHSSTPEKPKYRIILRLTRDVSVDEHALIWSHVHALCLAQNVSIDTAARDASRLFYVPARRKDAQYEWRELPGEPLPVDELLAAAVPATSEAIAAPATSAPIVPTVASRYAAAARLLAGAWPAPGARHEAKRALAGALWHAHATREEAESFLREVYKHVDPAPVDAHIGAVVGSTWAAGESGGNVEGWVTLATRVDVGIVQAARDLRSFGALEERHARLQIGPKRNAESVDDSRFGLINWDETDPPIEWVIGTILQAGTVNLAFGEPNSLKTWACYQMAACVASGKPWLGRSVKKGLCIILDYESSPRQARRRMQLLKQKCLGDQLRYLNPSQMLDDPDLWERLARLKPAHVLIDSLSRGMLGHDDNSTQEMVIPLAFAKGLARECNTETTLIHHKNKGGGTGHASIRGAGGIAAAAEGWLEFLDFSATGDVQRVTLHCARLKESTPFADIHLELSDLTGLTEGMSEPVKSHEDHKASVRGLLRNLPHVSKEQVVGSIPARRTTAQALVKEMLATGELVQSTEGGRGRKKYLSLNWSYKPRVVS